MSLSFSIIAGETARVYRVATKGQEKGGDFWVTSYYVSLSGDGKDFFNYSTEVTCVPHCHNVMIFDHAFPPFLLFLVCLFVCLFVLLLLLLWFVCLFVFGRKSLQLHAKKPLDTRFIVEIVQISINALCRKVSLSIWRIRVSWDIH